LNAEKNLFLYKKQIFILALDKNEYKESERFRFLAAVSNFYKTYT